jgi:ADP-heptose:LPS heptosyltransferase
VVKIQTDCRHYRTSVPCRPHKKGQADCEGCRHYDPTGERVLVIKLDAMGDVLRTTSCLPALKRLYPRSHVTWITRSNAVALLQGNPDIDRILPVESNYLEFLLTEEFDLTLSPDTDPLSASIASLARSTSKRGFVSTRRGGIDALNDAADQWWRMGLDDRAKRANRRTYAQWLYAICELPPPIARPCLAVGSQARDRAIDMMRAASPLARRRVCFNTGASGRWREKQWKAEHYEDLARLIHREDPDTAIFLTGGPGEAALNRTLSAAGAGLLDLGTDHSVEAFAAIVSGCDWVLTPDSLGYHVACAVGTPAVCLVGPTSPWELDLYDANVVLHADLECIACYLARCPLTTTCMDSLSSRVVWPLLSGRGATHPPYGVSSVPVGRA